MSVRTAFWRDLGVAVLLAGVLSVAWAISDWHNLRALRLPDTDDAMRLQQIRDWLGGQHFADLAQHRLGAPPGLEMHWSRIPDLVPAAIIGLLTPLVGALSADVSAVILWPALLFAAALALVASIARALGTSGPVAAVVGALAYPATTVFMPGRIDHHGLQLVLALVLVRGAIGGASAGWGVAAGLASVLSLVIGLEGAPILAVAGIVIVARWVFARPGAQALLAGYAGTLLLGLAACAALLRTSGWDYPACDGFTAQAWRAAQLAAIGPLALALLGPALRDLRKRAVAAVAIGVLAAGGALLLSPGCLDPYGAVDPLLARIWLAEVGEAQSLFSAPPGNAIGYAGLVLAGTAAAFWRAWRIRSDGWIALAVLLLVSLASTFAQLRGAYAGALLSAPALAALIVEARTRNPAALAGAWLVSAGLAYPLLGNALASDSRAEAMGPDCATPASLARIAALPPGRLMASVDLGAHILAGSRHRLMAAPYHRNAAGTLAMYRFYLGPADEALQTARRLRVDYVAWCPGDFSELSGLGLAPGSLAQALDAGHAPDWLKPVGDGVFRVAGEP